MAKEFTQCLSAPQVKHLLAFGNHQHIPIPGIDSQVEGVATVAHRDPVVSIPDIFDAWIVEDRFLYHRHFASLAWQAGASFTEILGVDAACTVALKADGAGGAMFQTVDDAADCTGLRALHAE
jgi:hypothetical protein